MNIHAKTASAKVTRKDVVRAAFEREGADAAMAQARKLKIKASSARTWISKWKNAPTAPRHISIRDLQKLSGETIQALPGTTAIKSGERTVALLIPFKRANEDRLRAVLDRAEALAKGRDRAEDDAALRKMGIDPTDYTEEVVREIQSDWRARIGRK